MRRPGWPWRFTRFATLAVDVGSLVAGLTLAAGAQNDGDPARVRSHGLLLVATAAVVVFVAASSVLRLHHGRHAIGSVEEIRGLAVAIGLAAAVTFAVDLVVLHPRPVPETVPLVGPVVAFALVLAFRLAVRSQREGAVRPRSGQPTLVFGAGTAGHQLIGSMLSDPASPYLPVGLLDDDPAKRHLRIRGVAMAGGRDRIAAAAAATGAEVLVIALPSAGSALVRDVAQRAADAGLTVRVLPGPSDLPGNRLRSGIREVRHIGEPLSPRPSRDRR